MAKRSVQLHDLHWPYHSQSSYNLTLDTLDFIKPDEIIITEFFDFYRLSKYTQDPRVKEMLAQVLKSGKEEFKKLSKRFPKSKKIYMPGNHCARLFKYLIENAPELVELVDLKEILKLELYDWQYIEYGPYQSYNVLGIKDFICRHEPPKSVIFHAKRAIDEKHKSISYGHLHTHQEADFIDDDGVLKRGISHPCLCGFKEYPLIFNFVKNHHQWSHGFGDTMLLDNKTWFHVVRKIINGKCLVDGVEFTAEKKKR